ncbi:uncharacterized protein LOC131248190 [Magnolia sinica]|uniref:uncharacterized protein LOC131248190 n=1 Tax=Magnolia sinica TaxID=86752 RepID=UPI00265B3324|nr:uncharacterized protein LOC131248190 [Magnolia sinica]
MVLLSEFKTRRNDPKRCAVYTIQPKAYPIKATARNLKKKSVSRYLLPLRSSMEEEEEVLAEVEAVQAVYGNDCHVIKQFPPHINVHTRPRTADDSSQQFVEAVLEIRASSQYPQEPPQVEIVESEGLDEKRQAHLITSIRDKAQELASCLMLVALCEEGVEILSNMNHPDGNCPLCLYPLVPEEGHDDVLPFMKLMSCFHCFHSECIIRWWKWLQEQNETDPSNLIEATVPAYRDLENRAEVHSPVKQSQGNCPVCRKVFHTKDIEHVLDLLVTSSSQLNLDGTSTSNDEEFLRSEAEENRRKKFEAILKLQQENSGLIEPRRNDVLLPGMYLPQPILPPVTSTETIARKEDEDSACNPPASETDLGGPSYQPGTSKPKSTRKNRGHHTRKHLNSQSSRKQWIKKDKPTLD